MAQFKMEDLLMYEITVRGLTRGRMLISEFCTARLQSNQSNLYICNSEIKQRQLGNQAAPTRTGAA